MKIIELFESDAIGEDEIIELIRRDCKPFLDKKPVGLLLRGMKNKPQHAFKQTVRTDRRPKDTPGDTHEKFNGFFKEMFGINARSECLFATSSYNIAHGYGRGAVYAVFPIGDFKFIWSENVDDLLDIDDDISFEHFKQLGYKTTDLNGAIKDRTEVMIQCKEYYAVPINQESGMDLYDTLVKP